VLAPWRAEARVAADVRRYRADAVITFLGLNIFSRSGVGSGYAFCDERGGGATVYGFAGGSWPERARGLNRLGYIREESGGTDSLKPANYVGVMTTSKEDKLEEARKSLETREGESSFTAIRGTVGGREAACTKTHFVTAQRVRWPDCRVLLSSALAALEEKNREHTQAQVNANAMSFLHAVIRATQRAEEKLVQTVAYNNAQYRLESERKRDEKVGRSLCELKAATDPARVWRLSAKLTRVGGTKAGAEFKIWFEEGAGSPLPLRIEHKARSFLRLVFEADPAVEHEATIELPPPRRL
jgi:hypothetical protein